MAKNPSTDMEQFEKEVKDMFKLFDKNGDESISADELGQLIRSMGLQMTQKEVKKSLKDIDTNRNGRIEFGEFRNFMLKQQKKIESQPDKTDNQKQIRQAFRLFDRDGDGFIEKKEFRKAMSTLGEPLTESELDVMMREADLNKDGKIDYEEFVIMWTQKTSGK